MTITVRIMTVLTQRECLLAVASFVIGALFFVDAGLRATVLVDSGLTASVLKLRPGPDKTSTQFHHFSIVWYLILWPTIV